MIHRLPCFRLAALPLALSCALPVLAQTTGAPSDAVLTAQASAPTLPDTVVTATRVAQPLTDVLADEDGFTDEELAWLEQH